MAIFKLPKRLVDSISKRIETLFDQVKGEFLGPKGMGKTLFFHKKPLIAEIYVAGVRDENGLPDTETLDTLIDTSKNYLDALKYKATNQVIKDIESHLSENDVTSESIEQAIKDSWDTATSSINRIIETETQGAKAIGQAEGIIQVNTAMGIKDPVVFWVTALPLDTVCQECKDIHLMPDLITPRLWYMSEVSGGYHVRGTALPSLQNLHPHCRCQINTLLDGYGFNTSGRIEYISKDFDAIKAQRNE